MGRMIQIDMPMPGDCEECPLNDEYAECVLLGKFVAKYGRLPDCPLREADIVFDKSKVFAFAMDDMTDEEYFDFLKNNSIMMRKGATDEPATED